MMKILFYDAMSYDKESFDRALKKYPEIEITYQEIDISEKTVSLAKGYDAICAFVNSNLSATILEQLKEIGISLVLLRCAGFNNVDLKKAKECGITVLRVPGYSPQAVAELAMTLALCVNRHVHKSYIRVRENNFSLNGLTGIDFYGKTAGIVGTGKIGAAMARICRGFGMKVIAYDMYPNPELDSRNRSKIVKERLEELECGCLDVGFVEYKPLEDVLKESDLISLHCPLTKESRHLINKDTIAMMKDQVIIINCARGSLADPDALIEGIESEKIGALGLDVLEREEGIIHVDHRIDIISNQKMAYLRQFRNVTMTPHMAFYTEEAVKSMVETRIRGLLDMQQHEKGKLEVV